MASPQFGQHKIPLSHDDDDMDEPTVVVDMLQELRRRKNIETKKRRHTSMNQSEPLRRSSIFFKGSAKKLYFSEDTQRSFGPLGPDPVADMPLMREITEAAKKRTPSDEESKEIRNLRQQLTEMEAKIVDQETQVRYWQKHAKDMEMKRRQDQIMYDTAESKHKQEKEQLVDLNEELRHKIDVLKRNENTRVSANRDEVRVLRRKVHQLEETNQATEAENVRLQNSILEYKSRISDLETRRDTVPPDSPKTRVLHFVNNPVSQLSENRAEQLKRLQEDNEKLKTRIRLLEEGHTKDLTLMVGDKLESEVSSKEVKELKEQLQSAEIKRERLIEAFKNTSKEFREVVCQLTGYRIYGLENGLYKLNPIYSDSEDDRLLFRRSSDGECQLLETPFSRQLTDMIQLHLHRQRSIPCFLAAVIVDLFSKQSFDTFSTVSDMEPSAIE